MEQLVQIAFLEYLMHYIGLPYLWGGKSVSQGGLDCSGFVTIALRYFNLGPPSESNAQALRDFFLVNGAVVDPTQAQIGDLCFYGNDTHIHHVAIAINNQEMLEAAHGDETVTSIQIANAKGARVMVSNINRLHDLYVILRPNGYPVAPACP